jgi:cytidyltransferase-like protein
MKIVLVSGGFDPLHSGHIAYFQAAKKLGDKLVVALNSDEWLVRKKGKAFMPWDERACIISALGDVDVVLGFEDSDNTAGNAIFQTLAGFPNDEIVFANGGDRPAGNVPEYDMYGLNDNIEFVFGVGGEDKKNSSSWILKDWEAPKVKREWGYYRNLYDGDGFKVKELVIAPHSALSMQKHKHRSETWNIVSGKASVVTNHRITSDPFDGADIWQLHKDNPFNISKNTWHQGRNDNDEPAHIVEIWKGDSKELTEDDIERYDP